MLDFIHEVHDVNQSQRAFSTGMNIHVGAARAVLTGFNVTLTYTNTVINWIFRSIFIFNCKMTWKSCQTVNWSISLFGGTMNPFFGQLG